MSIGSTIKRLRREKDITQEQLAEYLGITSRAISQWECDRTAPDISQIPALFTFLTFLQIFYLELMLRRITRKSKNTWIRHGVCVTKESGRNTPLFFGRQTKNSHVIIKLCRPLRMQ